MQRSADEREHGAFKLICSQVGGGGEGGGKGGGGGGGWGVKVLTRWILFAVVLAAAWFFLV